MTSSIVVGTDCPAQQFSNMIIRSSDFHHFHEKWKEFAACLNVDQVNIKRLMRQINLGTYQLTEVVREVIEIWVGKTGSRATLDKMIDALNLIDLTSTAELLKEEFQLKSSRWDVPSYYISRTLITRNILKVDFMEKLKTSGDIFVFARVSRSKLINMLKNKIVENSTMILKDADVGPGFILLDYPTHFNKICKKAKCPVHLLKFDEDKDEWIHVRSSENLSAFRNFSDTSQACITEAKLINYLQSEVHPVCISDSPGMGKSTLLYSIGQQLSKIENNRKVLFATMNDLVISFRQNDVHDDKKAALELTLNKLFCSNAGQTSSLSLKLNSKDCEIELLLDGLDEVAFFHTKIVFDLLKYLSTLPSTRVWVTTRPHLLHQLEECLNVFGYNIQAFTKQNQISFLKDFWLSRNKNLVTDRLKQFAEICLAELNAKMSRKDGDIAGIPLQCLLIGEVYLEQAEEHSVDTNPNETWIIHINSLVELYQMLIEKQCNKYKLTCSGSSLSEEQVHLQHIQLAVQLIFPELFNELPTSFKQSLDLNEVLKMGLLEKSNTDLKPKFVHRTIGEFYIAKFLIQLLNLRTDSENSKCLSHFIKNALVTEVYKRERASSRSNYDYSIHNFVNNEICHFFDALLVSKDEVSCVDIHLNFEMLTEACIYEDYFNLFKTIILPLKPNEKTSTEEIFNEKLLLFAIRYSGLPFLKVILESNDTLLDSYDTKVKPLLLSVRKGKLSLLQYLLNMSNVPKLVSHPKNKTNLVLHECVKESVSDSSFTVKQRIDILRMLLDINSDLLEQRDEFYCTPILCRNIHPELLIELIRRHANILAQNKEKNTILHVHSAHLDKILEELPTDELTCLFNTKNSFYETPLMKLIQTQEPTIETLKKFKEHGADFNCEDKKGYSVLAHSVKKMRTTETITRLIELGANVHWKKGWKRQSLLHIAGYYRNFDAMLFLVNQFKMNINGKDWNFKSPFEYYLGQYSEQDWNNLSNQTLNKLINNARKLNTCLSSENKIDMLDSSVKNMNDSALEFVLKDGVGSINKNTLCYIVKTLITNFEFGPGNKILQRFINSGIIKMYDKSLFVSSTIRKIFLLHWAVELGEKKIITCLIDEYKQNVNAADCDGKTPLHYLLNCI